MRKSATLALCLLVAAVAFAEEPAKKPLSPARQVEYKVGKKKKITIDYSAPSKRDRVIFGKLVPYGEVWRTGANAATTLTTNADLMIGSLHVPAGTYTLYSIPGEKEWTLIVNKQTGQWGTKYDEKQDLGRVKMKIASPLKKPVEQFVIGIDKTLSFTWDTTKVWVPLMVH
ncbi:MAG TPA: DUF2911 domain-containing protein [Thermoanaerobaculia bacterium]|jgi:hypothetical protein|nr:DUF2911 domain-containing protein [Thermoanaerobaculia bacterium]